MTSSRAYGIAVAGAICASATEGAFAIRALDSIAPWTRIETALAVSSLVCLAMLPVALAAAALFDRGEVRRLLGAIRPALAGSDRAAQGLATVLLSIALACTASRCAIVGRSLFASHAANMAATFTVLLSGGAFVASAVAVAVVVRAAMVAARTIPVIFPSIAPLLHACAIPAGGLRERLGVAGAILIGVDALLPADYAHTLEGFVVGAAIASIPIIGDRVTPLVRGPRGAAIVGSTVVGAVMIARLVDRLPPDASLGALYHAPIATMTIAAVHAGTDRDGDGESPWLLGGDCNDDDPRIHARAWDSPDDRIDQNCSGLDAPSVATPAMPAPRRTDDSAPSRANIVLVHIDALRPDHVGFAGYDRPVTPSLDRFRANATWFRRAYTPAPSTRFAIASAFTGLDVERLPQKRGPGIDFTLLPSATTLAEQLNELGYDRVGYTISYVIEHILGVGQGFRVWTTPWPAREGERVYGRDAALTTDAAISYLRDASTEERPPFFLFLHYQCTHDPYVRHAEWDFGARPIDVYDSALAYCDHQIGRLLDVLDASPRRDRTAVFFYSDHGELFGEHGYTGHGNTLYEPDVRVLLVARVPGATEGTIDTPVTLTDLGPTIASLAGATPRASDGWNLVPSMFGRGSDTDAERPLFFYGELGRGVLRFDAHAVVRGSHKLVDEGFTGSRREFDLARDPQERNGARAEDPSLALLLDAWRSRTHDRAEPRAGEESTLQAADPIPPRARSENHDSR